MTGKKIQYPANDPRNVKHKLRKMIPELIIAAWFVVAIVYAIFWAIGKFQ